jgi:hypothetical protein
MAGMTFTIRGVEELQRNLRRISAAMERSIMRAAIRTAMNRTLKPAVVAASPARKSKIANKARRRTKMHNLIMGPLKQSWSVIRASRSPRERLRFTLKSNTPSRDAFYAKFLEGGWLAGRRITKGEIRKAGQGGKPLRQRRQVPPRPFLAAALRAQSEALVDDIAAEANRRIESEVKGIVHG